MIILLILECFSVSSVIYLLFHLFLLRFLILYLSSFSSFLLVYGLSLLFSLWKSIVHLVKFQDLNFLNFLFCSVFLLEIIMQFRFLLFQYHFHARCSGFHPHIRDLPRLVLNLNFKNHQLPALHSCLTGLKKNWFTLEVKFEKFLVISGKKFAIVIILVKAQF